MMKRQVVSGEHDGEYFHEQAEAQLFSSVTGRKWRKVTWLDQRLIYGRHVKGLAPIRASF